MVPYLASGRLGYVLYYVSGRVAYDITSGVRPDSLCSHIWPPGVYPMLLYSSQGTYTIIIGQVADG